VGAIALPLCSLPRLSRDGLPSVPVYLQQFVQWKSRRVQHRHNRFETISVVIGNKVEQGPSGDLQIE
jgi:hypothetical protein